LAGTDAGVWSVDHRRALGEGIPPRAPDGLPNVVRALVADGTSLLAATDAGLFELGRPAGGADAPGPGGAWKPADGPRAGGRPLAVRALVLTPRGLLAATSAGVFRRAPAATWALVGTVPSPVAADAADGSAAPDPSAGADGKGAAEAGDCGRATPIPAPPGLNHPDVTTLAAGAGWIVAAAPYAGFPVEAWPSPPICPERAEPGAPPSAILYLAGVIPQVVPGSWIVLHQAPDPAAGGGPPAAVALVRVQATRILTLERYGLRGQATEVRVSPAGGPDGGLDEFRLRDTRVYAAARRLPLVSARLPRLAPVSGTRLRLAGAVPAPPAGRVISVTGKRLRAAVWPRAGVFVSGPDGWVPAGLASVDVDAVAWGPGGTLLAAVGGTSGAAGPHPGVYASADGGAAWLPAGGALDGVRVHALAAAAGAVWAASRPGALFTLLDGGRWTAAGTVGQAVSALAAAPDGRVYAATEHGGVLRREAHGGWTPAGRALPAGGVRALAASAAGVAAATAHGVWWLAAGAPAWTPWNETLSNRDVHAVALLPDGGALAGTWGGGVFASPAPGKAWAPASAGLDAPGARAVRVLAVTEDGRAWAGTQGAGCWVRPAGQAAWVPAVLGVANDVRALAAGPGGVIAGCGAVPLLAGGGPPRALLGLDGVLALDEGAAEGLDQGSLSTAVRAAFTAAGAALDPAAVVRVQEHGRAWWIDAGDGVLLLRRDAGAVRVRRPRGLATLMGPPHATSAGGAMADPEGSVGTLTPRVGELLWRPASAASQPVGEVARVAAGAAAGLRGTVLTLRSPLANAYDPATVQVCANLAPATHGLTYGPWPRPDVLGSGNASVAGQAFALPGAPLTWLAGAPGSTLRVWVNGVEWTEVETLFGRGPAEAAFEVRVDERGAAAVRFGDGVHGARLPTGVANVTAQYRVGIGPAGNLAAGRISVVRAAPLGVRSAVNPVAAEGGAPGQTDAEAAAAAPLRARVLERVVALQDFHDYALAFPGIARAAAEPLRDRRGRAVVVVTVAGAPGAEVPDAGLVGELEQAMRAAGAHGRFRVLACDALPFVLRARVDCDPLRRPPAVAAAASDALRAEFGPARRRLGQGVAASHVVAVLQAVPGVVGVELTALHLAGDAPAVCNYLEARGARVDPRGDVLAAQLLLPASSRALGVVAREAP
ncbi:MAG TPA: baseplate J/gp47 family protein, partial [Longimicrobium sp.]|nr:baseplate J/gp47 family protein [Longimicrobium sp.]